MPNGTRKKAVETGSRRAKWARRLTYATGAGGPGFIRPGVRIRMPWRIAETIRRQIAAVGTDASDSIRACCLRSVQNSDGIFACSEL